jgi:hypothetical protein
LVIDAGLGASAGEIFDIRLHCFPGFRSAGEAWPDIQAKVPDEEDLPPELAELVADGRLDDCGAVTIAGKAVGVPSTAIVAAVFQIAQVCRAINNGKYSDLIDVSLRNTARATSHEAHLERPELHRLSENCSRLRLLNDSRPVVR